MIVPIGKFEIYEDGMWRAATKWTTSLALLAILSGCQSTVAPHEGPPSSTEAKPKFGRFGIDEAKMDQSVAPGDSFFLYANGSWYNHVQFAPDETYVGARMSLISKRRERIRQLVETAASGENTDPTSEAIGVFYRSFLDEEAINRNGIDAVKKDLATLRSITSYQALFDQFARAPATGFPSPIEASTFYDFHHPGWIRYRLAPGGLGLRRETYLEDTDQNRELRTAYADYISDLLGMANETDVQSKTRSIVELETRLARSRWTSAEAANFMRTANSLPIEELQALAPDFDWHRFLELAGTGQIDTVLVTEPSSMKLLIETIRATPLETWRAWAIAHYLSDNAPYLSRRLSERRFEFYGKRVTGLEAQSPRWERGVELVENFFGMGVGRLYVQEYFSDADRSQVAMMFANIRAEMRRRIEKAEWMSDTTRSEALRKIDTLKVKIGYPDQWPDYSDLHFLAGDFFGNLKLARAFAWHERMALIQKPIPTERWQTTPQMSGAAANPVSNEITVPAGALEPPFFDPKADPAVNYGAIGGVLGHELSHMFDLLGRQFDAEGNLRDWWTPEDSERYLAIADRIATQYDDFEALPGLYLDGKISQNENIADISGLTLALAAYHRAYPNAKSIHGFTPDQRLFLGWAQMRAGKMRETSLREQVARGPHAPDEFRVDGVVRNIDAWYSAFAIDTDAKLYLAPQKRAHFW